MATTATGSLDTPGLSTRVSLMMSRRGKVARDSRRSWRGAADLSADQAKVPNAEALRTPAPVSPPGVIGAAVIRAARRSTHLTRPSLARLLNVSRATVRALEGGTVPLFSLPYSQLQQLAEDLSHAGALVGYELGELLLASRCDLLLTGMLHGFEDFAEVPPIEEDGTDAQASRDLLHWALAGPAPERYRQYASPCPLLEEADIRILAVAVRDLQTGSHGRDLVRYGGAFVALAGN